jgi:hypothetical protein
VEDKDMNKILVGLLVGAGLGAIDGATAWFTPQVRPEILSIIFFSTIKGIIAGIAAGWFARKVQSVPKGIAFGFVVGLILAFLVAMNPDPKTGEHYWWQIMLPGSVLGGVIGWATQRYGRPAGGRTAAASMATFAVLLFSVNAYASQPAQAAFDKLKTLAGTWNATMLKAGGDKTTVVYRVTGNGSVIEETMFAGTDHEMINMYTVDGDQLLARHYCSSGNQPLLRYNAQKSNGNQLVFDFVSKTGNDKPGYINGVTIRLTDDGRVVESWSSATEDPKLDLYLNSRRDPQSSR